MTLTKKQIVALAGTIIIIAVAIIVLLTSKRSPSKDPSQQAKIAAIISRVNQANAGLPDPQIQAKTLILTAMIQKKIPAAANWCDTLNAGNKLWPVTPTNTVFALNSQLAGHAYTRGMRSDTVVFFETSNPGWNQAGGPELLAKKTEGVAVALLDGRAFILSHDDAVKFNWAP